MSFYLPHEYFEQPNIELSSAAAYKPVLTVFYTQHTLPYIVQGDCSNDLLGFTFSLVLLLHQLLDCYNCLFDQRFNHSHRKGVFLWVSLERIYVHLYSLFQDMMILQHLGFFPTWERASELRDNFRAEGAWQ
jgi:hypothetical protein